MSVGDSVTQTIDLTPRLAASAFVGLKMRPQAAIGRKNRSGYAEEHKQANLDNAAYEPKSIGGISENLAISADDAGSIQNELS